MKDSSHQHFWSLLQLGVVLIFLYMLIRVIARAGGLLERQVIGSLPNATPSREYVLDHDDLDDEIWFRSTWTEKLHLDTLLRPAIWVECELGPMPSEQEVNQRLHVVDTAQKRWDKRNVQRSDPDERRR